MNGDPVSRLTVFVASPGDVGEERNRLRSVIDELNRGIALDKGYVLDLVRWETHAWPSVGQDAQDVINRQIPLPDIFVGILWKRFGSPTKRAESGTAEEFERAYRSWQDHRRPEIMFYFGRMSFFPESSEEVSQLRKVLQFKTGIQNAGVFSWDYRSRDEFESYVREHLTRLILAKSQQASAHVTMVSPVPTHEEVVSVESFLRHADGLDALIQRLDHLADGSRAETSVLYLDLDDFGAFNNEFGYEAGDLFLEAWAKVLTQIMVHKGTLFRISGDEFAAVLPNHDPEEARATAGRMQRMISEIAPGSVTVSIGLANSSPQAAARGSDLLRQARRGLTIAKTEGKNKVGLGSETEVFSLDLLGVDRDFLT